MRTPTRCWAAVAAIALFAAGCSEPEDEPTAPDPTEASSTQPDTTDAAPSSEPGDTSADDASADDASADDASDDDASGEDGGEDDSAADANSGGDGSVVSAYAGEDWIFGTVPASATPADDSLDPIRIGMINQENTPLGSFPEIRFAAETAIAWINAELGGVDGRPIELVPCITSFSVEQSQACAQEMVSENVVAVAGGIDVTSNGSIPILEQNGIPIFGGIPANLVEQRSPVNFFLSGGGAGGAAAFMAHAAENGAETVVLAYGEFESFEVAARDYGAAVGESLGLNVELVSFPIVATDFLPVLTTAEQVEADALIVLAADTACIPLMEGSVQLGLEAQLYLPGSCAADAIVEAAGDNVEGVIFNSEGPVDPADVEGALYDLAINTYAPGPAGGAGTVGFRGVMNLYSILLELGGDNITSQGITDIASAAVDRPSYWGHAYTCDGERVPGLPALCAPEQVLFTTPPGGTSYAVTDWIETDDLFQAAVDG